MRKVIFLTYIAFLILILPLGAYAAQHQTATDTLGLAKNYQLKGLNLAQMCEACHGTVGRSSVHNPTVTYTDAGVAGIGRCSICHDLHESQQVKCLPERTISDFCFLCHDGTAANLDGDVDSDGGTALGYYRANNVIYGLPTNSTPGARHRINANNTGGASAWVNVATDTIPLGGKLYSWKGQLEVLKCTSCHSAHGYQTVEPFWTKSPYPLETTATSGVDYGYEAGVGKTKTNMYLRRRVNTQTVTTYSSAWCAGCHMTAMNGVIPGDYDHPIDGNTAYQWFIPDPNTPPPGKEPIWSLYDSFWGGWSFTHKWQATSGAPDPLCLNCHDDPVDVPNIGEAGDEDPFVFVSRSSFPHESSNARFRVETGDDLCLNCHATTSLP